MGLGGFLVVQAASSLGGVGSTAYRAKVPWLLLPLFPLAVIAGQLQATEPTRAAWVFPFVNLVVVAVPSILFASLVMSRYRQANPMSWPLSWREVTSGFTWGAIGATTFGGAVNTAYLILGGAWFVHHFGHGDVWDVGNNIWTLDGRAGVVFDLSVLSLVAPLNEEFWKGSLVALFFFRKGGAARCFAWGVLAGTGFNLLETFYNSLAAVDPNALAEQTIGSQWWLFAVGRAGTAFIHGGASGLSALGIYGVLRRRWGMAPLYLAGAACHGTWNALAYLADGDALLSGEAPDARWLDVVSIGGMFVLATFCVGFAWYLSGRLKDERPASIYGLLGMAPAGPAPPTTPPFLLQELVGR